MAKNDSTSATKAVASGSKIGAIGTVKAIVGSATAVDQNGVKRELQVGDKVLANEVIQTSAAGTILIEFVNGTHLDVGRGSQVLLDKDVFDPSQAATEKSDVEAIQARIAAGADPTEVAEATAAGAGPGDEGGSSFVVVAPSFAQGLVTSGFPTTGIPTPEFQTPEQLALLENQPPLANDDNFTAAAGDLLTTQQGVALNIAQATLLTNDSDPDGDALTIISFTQPANGTVTQNPDGSFTYTPGEGFDGVDTFTYTVTDGKGATDDATVTINVLDVGPSVGGTAVTLDEEGLAGGIPGGVGDVPGTATTFSGTLTGFGFGGDGSGSIVLSGGALPIHTLDGTQVVATWGGDTLTGMAGDVKVFDIVVNQATGGYTVTLYQPVQHPVAGTEDDVSFAVTATVTDGDGSVTTGSFTVTIDDDTPNAENDVNGIASESNVTLTGNVLINDATGADQLANPVTPATLTGTYGTLVLNADGSYTYTLDPTDPQFVALAGGATATETFTYALSDADGDSDTATLTLTISKGEVDNGVTITGLTPAAQGGDASVDEDDLADGSDSSKESLTQAGSFTISAPDGVDDLTVDGHAVITNGVFAATSFTTALGNTLSITGYNAATGVVSYSYTLLDNETHAAGGDQNALFENFAVVLSDSDGDNTSSTLSVQIVDDVPDALNDANADTASENSVTLTGNVLANDVQGADQLANPVTPATLTGTYGTLVLNADGSYTYTLDPTDPQFVALAEGETATETFTYTLSDADGDSDTATLTLVVRNSNGVTVTDLTPQEQGGDVSVDEDDLADGSDTSKESLTQPGSFTISAPDGVDDLTVGGHAVITNGVFAATSFTTALGNTLSITGYNAATGVVSYSYTLGDNETHAAGGDQNALFENFAVVLSDSDGDSTSGTLSVRIVDDVPDAVADSNAGTASENSVTLTGNVLANDVQGADQLANPVTPATLAGTYGTLVLNADGSYTYTLDPTDPQFVALTGGGTDTETFTYTLNDADGDSDTAILTLSIRNDDDGVTITGLTPAANGGDVIVDEDDLADGSDTSKESLTQSGSFTISAPDGVDDLTVGGHAVITNGVFAATSFTTALGNTLSITGYNPATGVVSYSYTLGDNETHAAGNGENALFENFAVVLTDSDSDSTSSTLSVQIVDDVPDAVADSNAGTASENNITLTGNVLTNDIQGADHLAGPVTPATLTGTYGTLVLNADGSYTYTLNPADPDFVALTGGATDTETFTYTLNDADGDSDTATLTLAIRNDDSGVTITDLTPQAQGGDVSVDEDDLADGSDTSKEPLTQSGSFTISAPDGVDDLTVGGHAVITNGVFAATSFTTALGNTLSITGYNAATGVVSYSYTLGDNETHAAGNGENALFENFAVVLTDSDSDSTSSTLSVQIVDDVPTAVNDSTVTLAELTTVTGNLLANDTKGADGASLTHIGATQLIFGVDGWSQLIDTASGTLKVKADGSYEYAAKDVSASTLDSFTYTLTDGDGDISNASFGFQVSNLVPSAAYITLNTSNTGGGGDTGFQQFTISITNGDSTLAKEVQVANEQGQQDLVVSMGDNVVFSPGQSYSVILTYDSGAGHLNFTEFSLTDTLGNEVVFNGNGGSNNTTLTGGESSSFDGVIYTVNVAGNGTIAVTEPVGFDVNTLAGGDKVLSLETPTGNFSFSLDATDLPVNGGLDLFGPLDRINMSGSGTQEDNTLTLTAEDVFQMVDADDHTLWISGDAGDTVNVTDSASWTANGTQVLDGVTYNSYVATVNSVQLILNVENDVAHTGLS